MKTVLIMLVSTTLSFSQQFLRPVDTYMTTGHWQPNAFTLWETIDEVSPNNSDFNYVEDVEWGEASFSVYVNEPVGTPADGTRVCRFRARAAELQNPYSQLTLTVEVRRGFSKLGGIGVNLIESWQDFEFSFSAPSGWGGIFIKFSTQLQETYELLYVSWTELQVPNATGAIAPKQVMIFGEQ